MNNKWYDVDTSFLYLKQISCINLVIYETVEKYHPYRDRFLIL